MQLENHPLPIRVYNLCRCEWTNRANSYIIYTADQQASWNKLHVSKSDLSNPCPKLHSLCCLNTLLWSLSILWLPMDAHCAYHSANTPSGAHFNGLFFIIPIYCSTFLLKYLHVKNYRNCLRRHWETHNSHAGCVKHLYLGANHCVVFSWCSHNYFSISFYSDILITV